VSVLGVNVRLLRNLNFGLGIYLAGLAGVLAAGLLGLQPTIDAALTGAMSLPDALSTVEPALWQQHVVMPLFQLSDVLATGSEITGVNGGPPLVGPFGGAPTWRRSVRR